MKLAFQVMAGDATKEFLSELAELVERFEAAADKLAGKKAKPVDEDEEEGKGQDYEEEDETPPKKKKVSKDEDEEESEEESEEEEEAPKSKKKITVDQINDACKAKVKALIKKGLKADKARAKVLAILNDEFEVESVTELEPKQYEAALKALA